MKKKVRFFALILMAMFASNLYAQDSEVFTKTLITAGDYDSKWWRIPAIETAADGSLVAVFDKRYASRTDLPYPISIVCMRSTDNGRTWSEPTFIAERSEGHTYGDAALVLDTVTNELFCMYVGDEGFFQSNPSSGRAVIYYSKSSDNGVTWTAPKSINDQIYTGTRSGWYAAFAASGGALQMKNGRLMFVLCVRPTSSQSGYVDNWALYSDDHGETWQVSTNRATAEGNEAKVVELNNGDVLMSIRNPGGGMRRFCKSSDGGLTWGEAYLSTSLKDANCNGDILRYDYEGKSYLLHSLNNSSSQRRDVSVFVSDDNGATWPHHKQLVDGYAAYSSLTILKDGTLGCLIEEGHDGTFGIDSSFNIVYHNFSMDWLLEGFDESVAENAGPTPVYTAVDLDLDGSGPIRVPDEYAQPILAADEVTVVLDYEVASISDHAVFTAASNTTLNAAWGSFTAVALRHGVSPVAFGMRLGTNSGDCLTYGDADLLGQRIKMAITMSATSNSIYKNGAHVRSINESTSPWPMVFSEIENADALYIGGFVSADSDNKYPLTGKIHSIRYYTKELTAAEIAALEYDNLVTGGMEAKPCVVSFASAENGTFEILEEGVAIESGDTVMSGTTLTVVTNPAEGYVLNQITVNGTPISGSTFTVSSTKTTVAVTFMEPFPEYCAGTAPNNGDGNHYGVLNGSLSVNGTEAFTFISRETIDDFSNTCIAEVHPGDVIQLYVSGGNQHSSWAQAIAYFDWNMDGTWNTTSDEAYELFNNPLEVVTNHLTEITVPDNAAIGSLGLRICSGEAPEHNTLGGGPCQARRRGRLQTFRINVREVNTTELEKTELTDNAKIFYANDQIHTNLEGEITVFDLTGKPVKRSSVAPLSVSNLAKGVYIVRIAGETMKFVR